MVITRDGPPMAPSRELRALIYVMSVVPLTAGLLTVIIGLSPFVLASWLGRLLWKR